MNLFWTPSPFLVEMTTPFPCASLFSTYASITATTILSHPYIDEYDSLLLDFYEVSSSY